MDIPQHNNKEKNTKSKINEMKNTTQNVKIQFSSEKKNSGQTLNSNDIDNENINKTIPFEVRKKTHSMK